LTARPIGTPLPEADLLILAVRDDSVYESSSAIAGDSGLASRVPSVVHLSGLLPVQVLDPLGEIGLDTGAFHPLQTLPDWCTGSRALGGAYVGITATGELYTSLEQLAGSLGCHAFPITDPAKALYHAAAAASTNFVLVALGMAEELFREAGLDHRVVRPLVEHTVANAFNLGISSSLTGPIVRGDTGTVGAHLDAVDLHAPLLGQLFRTLARATARIAGTEESMEDLLS